MCCLPHQNLSQETSVNNFTGSLTQKPGECENVFLQKCSEEKQHKTTDLKIQRSKPLWAAIYCSLKTNKRKNYNHEGDVILIQNEFDRDSADLIDIDMQVNIVTGLV